MALRYRIHDHDSGRTLERSDVLREALAKWRDTVREHPQRPLYLEKDGTAVLTAHGILVNEGVLEDEEIRLIDNARESLMP